MKMRGADGHYDMSPIISIRDNSCWFPVFHLTLWFVNQSLKLTRLHVVHWPGVRSKVIIYDDPVTLTLTFDSLTLSATVLPRMWYFYV